MTASRPTRDSTVPVWTRVSLLGAVGGLAVTVVLYDLFGFAGVGAGIVLVACRLVLTAPVAFAAGQVGAAFAVAPRVGPTGVEFLALQAALAALLFGGTLRDYRLAPATVAAVIGVAGAGALAAALLTGRIDPTATAAVQVVAFVTIAGLLVALTRNGSRAATDAQTGPDAADLPAGAGEGRREVAP